MVNNGQQARPRYASWVPRTKSRGPKARCSTAQIPSVAKCLRRSVARLACLTLAFFVAWPLHAGSTLAPERIYAQELVNETVAAHPDLLVVAMHVTPPGASENVIIASNIGRIGKKADAEIPAVLEPLVLLDRARVCQMHLVAGIHQSVDQPIPVVRTLDHHACQILTMQLQCGANLPQIVGQTLTEHDPVFFVADDHYRIVRVQVYATIFHVGLRRVKAQLRKLTLTPPLQRGEEAG